jgi:hydroxymethylbilane synthase
MRHRRQPSLDEQPRMARSLRIGTRGSALALQQTRAVVEGLRAAWPDLSVEVVEIRTTGDRIQDVPLAKIGDKGLFVKEIEESLLHDRIDCAVHSVKDLPSELPRGLGVAMLAARGDPHDVLVARHGLTLSNLPTRAVIGTSSLRRRAQLLHWRPDLTIVPLRGNVDTRLRKLESERLDGIVIAAAGLLRLGWEARISDTIAAEICLPAVGQGALGVEMRSNHAEAKALLQPLTSGSTKAAVSAERSFLARLAGGCQVPVAAWAVVDGERLYLRGMISDADGRHLLRGERWGMLDTSVFLGEGLAEELLQRGGDAILRDIYGSTPASEVGKPR